MAQGHSIWPTEVHIQRDMNGATVTSPSTFAALFKNVHWLPELEMSMEARKVQLDGAKLAPSPFFHHHNSGTTGDGLWRRLRSHLHKFVAWPI